MRAYLVCGVVIFFSTFFSSLKAQNSNTVIIYTFSGKTATNNKSWNRPKYEPLPVKSLVIPGLMIAYGVTALNSDGLEDINCEVKEEVWTEHPHSQVHLDNYLQFVPAIAVYGLNLIGIKGKHNMGDATLIYTLSNLILVGTVYTLKCTTARQRPDGSGYTSFPSGHTAEAFASAEFLRQEYKDVSPWYGVAGYAIAVTTGYLRMYNNKHWLSDVVAGAGIGMASTKIAYWLYPRIQRMFSKNKPMHTMIMPTYQSGAVGLALVHKFN